MWLFSSHRYDNKGCGRSYLSQRDLEAHAIYRHAATPTSSSTYSTVAAPMAANTVVTSASNTIPFSYSFLTAMPRPPDLTLPTHVRFMWDWLPWRYLGTMFHALVTMEMSRYHSIGFICVHCVLMIQTAVGKLNYEVKMLIT